LLSGLNLSLPRLLSVWATSNIVAWLVALIAYRLPFWLTGGKFIPRPIPVPVILRAVVPVISVLTVPFGTNTGVIRRRIQVRKTPLFVGSM
jgi:hypothetical protein